MENDSLQPTAQRHVQQDELLERIGYDYSQLAADKRLIVGIAGAPASGKSTLAESLVKHLNATMPDTSPAIVVPMDGFHLDNAILDERNLRPVKGSPQTFDAVGFLGLLQRLSEPVSTSSSAMSPTQVSVGVGVGSAETAPITDNATDTLYIPVFDRAMDIARANACALEAHHRLIIVEGNYLLLKRPVWRELAAHIDISVLLDVPLPVLEGRLVQRWIKHGFDKENATKKALSNDIPNARLVNLESAGAHLVINSVRQ